MFEDYKKDLIKVFKRLYDEGAFSGLFDKLSQSDHYIKIRYSTVNALEDAGDKPEHPLCYLYNHKLIFDRNSFLQERGTFLPNDDITPDIFDDDLLGITSIASNTVILFENYFYKVIEKAEKRYEIKVKELNLNKISSDDYAINIIGNSSNSIDPGIIAGLGYHQYFGKGFLGINFTYIPSKKINYDYSWVGNKYYISDWNELEEVDIGGNIIFLVTGTNF